MKRVSLWAQDDGLPLVSRLSTERYVLYQITGVVGLVYVLWKAGLYPQGTEDLALKYNGRFKMTDYEYYFKFNWYLPYIATWLVLLIGEQYTRRKGDLLGTYEWRSQVIAKCMTPYIAVLMSYTIFASYDPFTALLGGVINSWPLIHFIAFNHGLVTMGVWKTWFPHWYAQKKATKSRAN